MIRITTAALLATLLIVGGCASTPEQGTEGKKIEGVKLSAGVVDIAKKEGKVELEKDKRVNCEKYKPIGSNRVQYRCTTVAEKQQSEEDGQAAMRKMVAPPPSTAGSGVIR